MIEIQCTSCHTRYRIDERVLPQDNPTFKCSRCGHVFTTNSVGRASEAPRVETPRPRVERARREAPPVRPAAEEPEPPKHEAPESRPEEASGMQAQSDALNPPPQRPYVRAPRAPVFQPVTAHGDPVVERQNAPRASEEAPPPPQAEVDDSAVARMRAAMASAPEPSAPAHGNEAAQGAAAQRVAAETPQRPGETPVSRAEPPRANAFDREERRDEGGENLSFAFDDDRPGLGEEEPERPRPDRWSVGDDIPYIPQNRAFGRPEPAPFGRGTIPEYAGSAIMERERMRDDLPDDAAFLERAAGLHSAGYFIGLFFFVAVVFTVLTLVICGAPSASADLLSKLPVIGPNFAAPTPLETMVAVSDIQAHYETIKGGHPALVLSGIAENTSQVPLHVVEIGVRLLDPARHPLASSAVYCGNTLSAKMITEMTPHELEFLQKLDPQKNFVLEPSHSAPFLMVFIDPPPDVSRFAVAVAKAEPPAAVTAPAAAAATHP